MEKFLEQNWGNTCYRDKVGFKATSFNKNMKTNLGWHSNDEKYLGSFKTSKNAILVSCYIWTWNYNTNRNNMQENPLLHALLSLQVVYC